MMYDSLSKITALPDDTWVYCAHEYTLENIQFAKAVEPNNPDLIQRELDDRVARATPPPSLRG